MAKKFKFEYTICPQFDAKLFKKQCAAFEKRFPNLKKAELLQDVDGSSYQSYQHEHGEILVSNNADIGCLYVESDFDLEPYFN